MAIKAEACVPPLSPQGVLKRILFTVMKRLQRSSALWRLSQRDLETSLGCIWKSPTGTKERFGHLDEEIGFAEDSAKGGVGICPVNATRK